jgi:uncharacterized damage-inducible protein DinB
MHVTTLEQQLKEVFENFSTPLTTLSTTAINAPPKEGNWTIAQVAKHIVLATTGIPDQKCKEADRPVDQFEPSIRDTFLGKQKMQSQEFLTPEKKSYELETLLSELKNNREGLLKIVKEKDLNQVCLDIALPGWGYLTRYEWIKLNIYHVKRHTQQLLKLMNAGSTSF